MTADRKSGNPPEAHRSLKASWPSRYRPSLDITCMRQKLLDATVRGRDIAGALLIGSVSAPLWSSAMLLVRIRLGPPALFRQLRPGLGGVPFTLLKLRTMHAPTVTECSVTDEERLTPLGRFLRSTSVDELPELWNVIRGDMSLIGPRPLLMEYLDRYTSEELRRHEVKPGITGWAQVNGRNALSWEERLALGVWYVDNRSLRLDFVILWRTVKSVLHRDGISAAGHATMPEFLGSIDRTGAPATSD